MLETRGFDNDGTRLAHIGHDGLEGRALPQQQPRNRPRIQQYRQEDAPPDYQKTHSSSHDNLSEIIPPRTNMDAQAPRLFDPASSLAVA